MSHEDYTIRLAELTHRYKKWQDPRHLRDLFLFKYNEVKQGLGYAQRMHKGRVKGAVLTGLGHKLARHYFKYGDLIKTQVDKIYADVAAELPEDI